MSDRRRSRHGALLLAAFFLITPAVASADQPVLQSRWEASPGAAGGPADPPPSFTAVGPDKVFKLALSNNADRLFLTLQVTDDDARLLLLSRGFIVWFDPAGGQHQVLGVEFPLEPLRPARGTAANDNGAKGKGSDRPAQQPPDRVFFDPGQLLDHEQKSGQLDQLAVLTGSGPGRLLPRSNAAGIRVSIQNEAGVL